MIMMKTITIVIKRTKKNDEIIDNHEDITAQKLCSDKMKTKQRRKGQISGLIQSIKTGQDKCKL